MATSNMDSSGSRMEPIEIDDDSSDDDIEVIAVRKPATSTATAARPKPKDDTKATSNETNRKSTGESLKRKRADAYQCKCSQEAVHTSAGGNEDGKTQTACKHDHGKTSTVVSLVTPGRLQLKLFATVQDQQARRYGTSKSSNSNHQQHCQTLRQMLGIDDDAMEWMVAANFLLDAQFLLDEVPELISCPKLIIFYEHGQIPPHAQSWSNIEFIHITPRDEPCNCTSNPSSSSSRTTSNPLKYKFAYGSHHTKLFIIGYKDRLRVIVHTANLTPVDIHKKAQGAYIQDFPLKRLESGSGSGLSKSKSGSISDCDFEQSLIAYVDSYGYNRTHHWSQCLRGSSSETAGGGEEKTTLKQQLSRYDYSSTNAVLIPSIPGYYDLPNKCRDQGYLKLKSAIDAHIDKSGTRTDSNRIHGDYNYQPGPLVCQFSSIGSLSEKWLREFVSNASIPKKSQGGKKDSNKQQLVDMVKLVYPTAEEIRSSIEGYAGGNSVPGRSKNLQKPFLKPLYCKWASSSSAASSRSASASSSSSSEGTTRRDPNPIHKPNNVPHIKSYYQLTPDKSSMEWFVLGSHNLSKAAWGEVINGKYGKCLRVSSWELGVFVSPQLTGGRIVPWCGENQHTNDGNQNLSLSSDTLVPLPYNKEPDPYHSTDEPWAVDKVYNRADKFGNLSAMSMLGG